MIVQGAEAWAALRAVCRKGCVSSPVGNQWVDAAGRWTCMGAGLGGHLVVLLNREKGPEEFRHPPK